MNVTSSMPKVITKKKMETMARLADTERQRRSYRIGQIPVGKVKFAYWPCWLWLWWCQTVRKSSETTQIELKLTIKWPSGRERRKVSAHVSKHDGVGVFHGKYSGWVEGAAVQHSTCNLNENRDCQVLNISWWFNLERCNCFDTWIEEDD